jgi:hypothetical protein
MFFAHHIKGRKHQILINLCPNCLISREQFMSVVFLMIRWPPISLLYSSKNLSYYERKKFKQWWSTIPQESTKRTITSNFTHFVSYTHVKSTYVSIHSSIDCCSNEQIIIYQYIRGYVYLYICAYSNIHCIIIHIGCFNRKRFPQAYMIPDNPGRFICMDNL